MNKTPKILNRLGVVIEPLLKSTLKQFCAIRSKDKIHNV
jgi:hypothetical protein